MGLENKLLLIRKEALMWDKVLDVEYTKMARGEEYNKSRVEWVLNHMKQNMKPSVYLFYNKIYEELDGRP